MAPSRRSGIAWALLTAILGAACATGGSAVLSRTELTAEQLAATGYETVYDLLKAHNRARIVTVRGDEFLLVYSRGGDIRSGVVTVGGGGTEGQAREITGTAAARTGGEALLFVNDRQVFGNVTRMLQQIPVSRVASLEILRPTQTSARYGGSGFVGSVVIWTRDGS